MVQLEPITAMRKMETIASFNSIMVQLEPPLQSVALPTSVFQFHKGSIRTSLSYYEKNRYSVSIPLWFN